MAKRIAFDKSKVEFIELDFIDKDGKTHREKFMLRGKDGKTFFVRNKKKTQHFGINKIKSLIKVVGLYKDTEHKKLMGKLFSEAEVADVTYEEFGKEKTEEFLTFPDLIGKKVKICITSKKENSQMNVEQDDESDQKYVEQCIRDTKKFVKANPKKKSLKKFAEDADYVNVYRWFTNSSVAHFCSLDGLFASELEDGEGKLLDKFLKANEVGEIFDGRTLKPEDLSERELKKLGINEYGKRIDPEDEDDDYDDDEELEEEEDEKPKKSKSKAKSSEEDEEDDEDEDW
jgi:hypothetical protein